MAPRKKRLKTKVVEFSLPVNQIVDTRMLLGSPVGTKLRGEWTKETAVMPQNMRDDPLSVFVNTMNLWGLMATGWCAIARASWGLD